MSIARCGSAKGVCVAVVHEMRLSWLCSPASCGVTAAVNHVRGYDESHTYSTGADALVGPKQELKSIAWLHTAISEYNIVRYKKLLKISGLVG